MRGSICLAAGLLVTNVVLLRGDAPPAPVAKPILVESLPRAERVTPITTESQRLQWFWHAKHNGLRLPDCAHFDPVATLDADVDPAPGHEHLFGNRRFGVMMFDAQGTFLAHMDPIGCAAPSVEDQSLSLTFDDRLIVRTRNMLDDGEHLAATVVERRGDELVTLLELDTGGRREHSQVDGRIVMGSDTLEVIYHGRHRSPGGAWEAVDNHCTWQIATRTFSCRTRAGARTRESE